MKYEMIFGDEKLFDGAPEDVDMIGRDWVILQQLLLIRYFMLKTASSVFNS